MLRCPSVVGEPRELPASKLLVPLLLLPPLVVAIPAAVAACIEPAAVAGGAADRPDDAVAVEVVAAVDVEVVVFCVDGLTGGFCSTMWTSSSGTQDAFVGRISPA